MNSIHSQIHLNHRKAGSLTVIFQGALFVNHSLAHVNRELCLQLLDKQYSISFVRSEPDAFDITADPRFYKLESLNNLSTSVPDITIRHQWPPDLTPVASGKLVLIQPWEFGSLPSSWIEPIQNHVDEVWAYTNYVRDCYLKSGVAPEKVHVVPLGVNTQLFTPSATPRSLLTRKSFRFLFVGGTIQRKGIDILLGAYRQAFTGAEDVCLVIKDMGGSSFYQGRTAQELIERFRSDPQAPEVEYIDKDLSATEMASLYTACHCLAHPYRGEGFGLPIAEAMACGLAPIVTGYGAALDFCSPETAWLLPAKVEKLPIKQVGQLETVDYPWLAEPDFNALVALLLHAVQNPEEVQKRGIAAADFIHENYTWKHAARIADKRLRTVAKEPISRLAEDSVEQSKNFPPAAQGRLVGLVEQQPVQAAVREASRLSQRGELDQAVQLLLNQGIRVAADDPSPYVALAELLIREGRFQDAMEVLPEMPVTVDPALKQELAAICHCGLGAAAAAHHAAQHVGERPRVLTVLGTLAARQGDLAEAECLFRQAIQNDPACGSGWLALGMLLWGQGLHEEAFEALKRAVIVDPLNREAVQILRDMAERLERQLATVEILISASQTYPDCRQLALHKALLLARVGQATAASVACEEFLVRFGADDQLLEAAGALRERAGLYDRLAEAGQQSISLCMIVKDEEACLARCLASAKPAVHELVVVDTGSSDRTVAIATAFGARVSQFSWNGSFADARNHALEQARGNLVLVLDADEVISAQDHAAIAAAVSSAANRTCAYSVLTRNYTTMIHAQGWTANDGSYPAEERAEGWQPSTKVRLFPNDRKFRFRGDVHEMVEPSLREAGIKLQPAPFVVHHYGELEQDPVKQLDKKLGYFEAGMQKLAQQPDDLAAISELAVQAGELGRLAEAIGLWNRVLEQYPDCVEALFNKGYCLMGLQRYTEALECSRRALALEPAHKEAAFNYGTCELYVGDPQRALTVVTPVAAQHPDYPLLKSLLAVLYLATDSITTGQNFVQTLLHDGYGINGYIQERVAVLTALHQSDVADRITRNRSGG